MNMKRAKVPPKLLLLLDSNVLEILIPKDNNAALGNQQGQLVFLQVVQL